MTDLRKLAHEAGGKSVKPVRTCAECGKAIPRKRDAIACHVCAATCCPEHSYYYVDGNNGAITKSAKPTCRQHAR